MRLIDADALKEAIIEHRYDYVEDNFFWTKLFDIIDNAPTVETNEMTQDLIDKVNVNVGLAQPIKDERPQGVWIKERTSPHGTRYRCDNCNKVSARGENFCSKCGADMRKGGAK